MHGRHHITPARQRAMQAGRDRARRERAAPEYPPALPELRRRITVEDFDFGRRVVVVELYRTRRLDCYRVEIDGKRVPGRYGWARVLAMVRARFLRVRSVLRGE